MFVLVGSVPVVHLLFRSVVPSGGGNTSTLIVSTLPSLRLSYNEPQLLLTQGGHFPEQALYLYF